MAVISHKSSNVYKKVRYSQIPKGTMTYEIGIVIGVIVVTIGLLYFEVFKPALTLFLGTVVLISTSILTPREALNGFANEQLSVIVLLLVIGNIFKKSSIVDSGFRYLLNNNDSSKSFLVKMSLGIGSLSAFFNNTPLVAMMMPYIFTWCREKKLSVSKFLIPLSYASILGGCITLIGTSTNLIVNGLAMDKGYPSLGIFDFTIIGLPMLVIGTLYLVFFSGKLLPSRGDVLEDVVSSSRKFFFETVVGPDSKLIGKTIEGGGLRNLDNSFLVEIYRNGRFIRPVSSKETIYEGDLLFFAGQADAIADITNSDLGLLASEDPELHKLESTDVVEVVISHNSKLSGQKVRDTDFRGMHDGAILAIHRNGEKLWGQLGQIELRSGDVLLVMAGNDFMKRAKSSPAFYVLSKQEHVRETNFPRIMILLLGMFTAITLSALSLVPLFTSLSVLVAFALLLKVTEPKEILSGIDFHLVLVIAMGLSLGKAMTNTGADDWIADGVLSVSKSFGITGVLVVLFLITNILSAIVTTQAAVAVTLPVALQLGSAFSASLGTPIEPFILVIAFAGAANFITPIGYQTNLMVYGPGGYKFRDYFRVGLPLTIIYLGVCVGMLVYWYQLY